MRFRLPMPRIQLKALANLCRSLSTLLVSGLPIVQALEVAGGESGSLTLRRRLLSVRQSITAGDDLSGALRAEGGYFPELFNRMVAVAESTGSLAEVLRNLADHYETQLRIRRDLRARLVPSFLKYAFAVCVIAFVIWLLGEIAQSRGGEPLDITGVGLVGQRGAAIFLVVAFGLVAGLFAGYWMIAHVLGRKRFLDGLLLRVPVIGACLRDFALARFTWAFHLTQEAGMPLPESLDQSLAATNNGAFQAAAQPMKDAIVAGGEMSDAMREARVFPIALVRTVEVAEASGTLPETMHRASVALEEDARRSLARLSAAVGWLVWALVAAVIIFAVFRIVMTAYIGPINEALEMTR